MGASKGGKTMPEAQTFNLDRKVNIENDVDALGKKWEVHKQRGRALFIVRPNPDREDAVIPKTLSGEWTQEHILRENILTYVTSTWDQADLADVKAERKRQVALEAKETTTPVIDKKLENNFIQNLLNKKE